MLACARRKSRADRVTTEYLRYGEDAPDAVDHNLRGRVWRVFDQAWMVASVAHDYRGNLIESTRRLTQAYTGTVDWAALADATTEEGRDDEADALLYAEVFTTTSAFDALGRPVEMHPPRSSDGARATTHARTVRMAYNQSGLLARVEVQLGTDEAAFGTYVDSITYNARRQRTGIVYGNGVETALTYDAESFRLTRLYTTREVATDTLVGQDLRYSYDAVGNITRMDDHAVMVDDEERMVHAGPQLMEPVVHAYTYDPLGRLITATGREHPGLLPTTTPLQPGSSGYDRGGPHPNDLAALEDYVEQYAYDAVGNFLTMQHAVPSETTHSWTRHYLYEGIGNRLTKTHGGDATGPGSSSYGYDEHGNMLSMPHLAEMDWNAGSCALRGEGPLVGPAAMATKGMPCCSRSTTSSTRLPATGCCSRCCTLRVCAAPRGTLFRLIRLHTTAIASPSWTTAAGPAARSSTCSQAPRCKARGILRRGS